MNKGQEDIVSLCDKLTSVDSIKEVVAFCIENRSYYIITSPIGAWATHLLPLLTPCLDAPGAKAFSPFTAALNLLATQKSGRPWPLQPPPPWHGP